VSNGGAAFFAGKSINNKDPKEQASIAGSVCMALHVRQMAKYYGIPVVIHSDHCAKGLLPWFDGMLAADEEYFEKNGEPLFSSHMLDLSEEVDPENIETCKVSETHIYTKLIELVYVCMQHTAAFAFVQYSKHCVCIWDTMQAWYELLLPIARLVLNVVLGMHTLISTGCMCAKVGATEQA
jgi:Fructose-bisphosphate aldolase class-II